MARVVTERKGLETRTGEKEKKVFRKGYKPETVEEMNKRLVRWLNSPMDKMPYIAMDELHKNGRGGMPALIEALSNSDRSIRASAAIVMSQIGTPRELRCLKMLLSDRSPVVCMIAEMAVCEIVKRHFKEFSPKSVETIAARLGGRYGRELDRLLGKDVPEPPRSKSDDDEI
jgi:hypothetical protein